MSDQTTTTTTSTTTTTTRTTEDLAKADIIEFLRVYRTVVFQKEPNTLSDYEILLNGGAIRGQKTEGFLALKNKIRGYMNLGRDNTSVTLEYIQNYNNNK